MPEPRKYPESPTVDPRTLTFVGCRLLALYLVFRGGEYLAALIVQLLLDRTVWQPGNQSAMAIGLVANLAFHGAVAGFLWARANRIAGWVAPKSTMSAIDAHEIQVAAFSVVGLYVAIENSVALLGKVYLLRALETHGWATSEKITEAAVLGGKVFLGLLLLLGARGVVGAIHAARGRAARDDG